MRSTQTILGLVTSACVTLTPAYAAPTGVPAPATPHPHLLHTRATPTITGKAPSMTRAAKRSNAVTPVTTLSAGHSSTTAASSTTLNPIEQKISSHPRLASKVQALLPAGTTLNQASAHFKNQGQFLAALHVSKNLGIPFSKLKADMTSEKHLSLGQSIHDLRPRANAATEARHAETEADHDVRLATRLKPGTNPRAAVSTAEQEVDADLKAATPQP